MKRIILIFATLVAVVSCFDDSTYSQSGMVMASFEFYGTNYNELFGSDSLYFDTNYKVGVGWEPFAFYHSVNKETAEFEGGFILSYLSTPASGMTEGLANNLYRSVTKDTLAINTFLVFCQTDIMPEHDMGFTYASSTTASGTCIMNSCYVNNTVAVADAVKEHFVPGDKLVLKARGYLAGKMTKTAEVTLAEKTTTKDSLVTNWIKFDLSALGSIDKVDFEIQAPDNENIPRAVCIDNVMANVSLSY